MTSATTWIGAALDGGRYEVFKKVGEGGMAYVYLARATRLDRNVVIKVPRQALLEDLGLKDRMVREVRALVDLDHPHIVKILDVGQHNGLPFFVMQYLPGGNLEERRPRTPEKAILPCEPAFLSDWLGPIATALDFANDRGFIHRDVKPANILFDAEGNAYLADFGIAKALEFAAKHVLPAAFTNTGMLVGTAQYLAPELIMPAKFGGRIDRVDQYALAVLIYELISGEPPFSGDNFSEIVAKHCYESARDIRETRPTLPGEAAYVIHKGLTKDPSKRFTSCREMVNSFFRTFSALETSIETTEPTQNVAPPPLPGRTASGGSANTSRNPVWEKNENAFSLNRVTYAVGGLILVVSAFACAGLSFVYNGISREEVSHDEPAATEPSPTEKASSKITFRSDQAETPTANQEEKSQSLVAKELLGIEEVRTNRVALLVDCSGSMHRESRWSQVLKIICSWHTYLDIHECVAILFEGDITVFPESGMLDLTGESREKNLTRMLDQIASVKPGGWTNTLSAFERAFTYDDLDTIILITDGNPSSAISAAYDAEHVESIFSLVDTAGNGKVQVVAIGIGDDSPELISFLRGLAKRTRGVYVGR